MITFQRYEEQLPDESSIPRSLEPSCELVEAEVDGVEQTVLLACRDIAAGEPFSVGVSAEDSADFEQWELDTTTGEMVLVQ